MLKKAWPFAFALALPAVAHADVVNGSFESDYSGWSLSKQASSQTFATAAVIGAGQVVDPGDFLMDQIDNMSIDNYSTGLPVTADPTDGDYQALLLQNGPSVTTMSQIVTLPVQPELSFDLAYHNWEDVFSQNQSLQVQVLDLDTDRMLGVVYEATGTTDLPMSHEVIDLSAFSQMTVKLQLELVAKKNFFDVQLDNVHVVSQLDKTVRCPDCQVTIETDDAATGGCSSTKGGSSATALAALALVAIRRRRR